MNPESTIQGLGIRIANDAITIATLQAENDALRAENARLAASPPDQD